MSRFEKATKEQSKLRLAIFGPSGAGKTFTALRVATGMVEKSGGKIALLDTEYRSASKYSDRFDFDTADMCKDKDIDGLAEGINEASAEGYEVLIIDSLSHAWQELLAEVDKLAMTKYKGNTWSAWSEGTPKQKGLVNAILSCPCHIIATMRSKTEWTTESTSKGTSRPVRVGLAPEQGKGIEYEFDMLMEMSTEHIANIIKDRSDKYQDKIITKPGEDFGRELIAWLNEGRSNPKDQVIADYEGKMHEMYGADWREKSKEIVHAATKGKTKFYTALHINQLQFLNERLDEQMSVQADQEADDELADPFVKNGSSKNKKSKGSTKEKFREAVKEQTKFIKDNIGLLEEKEQEAITSKIYGPDEPLSFKEADSLIAKLRKLQKEPDDSEIDQKIKENEQATKDAYAE